MIVRSACRQPRPPRDTVAAPERGSGAPAAPRPATSDNGEHDAVRPTDPSHPDHPGHRARPQLPARGRARPGAAHGARRPGPGLLRAPRAAVEVPEHADRAAPAEEGPQAPRVRRDAAAAARGPVGGRDRLQPRRARATSPRCTCPPGEGIVVREHQFLAATGDVAVRLQPDQGLRQHDVRRRLLRRPLLRRRPRGRGLGPRLRQRVREAARAGRDDRHRARRLGLPRPLGPDVPGGLRLQDRASGRRRATSCSTASPVPGRVGLQSAYFHPPVPEGAGGNAQREAAAACSAGSSAACSTTSDGVRRPAIWPSTRCPPGSSARSAWAATSCWPTSPGVGAGRLGRRRSCSSRPIPTRRCPTPARRSRCTSRGCATRPRRPAFTQLAAQLGYLRLSGYRLALERYGLRSKVNVVNPATGGVVATIPDKHPGRLFGGGGERRHSCWPRRARCRPPARRRTPRTPS